MMRQKLLHELLDEDQEPFFVATYINKNHTQLQLNKPKPISQPTRLAGNLCKNSCFFTLPDSPDPRKSPIYFSVRQSPKSPNNIFLHVPAKTAALLLEAALKIQRSKTSAAAKRSTTTTKPPRFGLFGSLFKKLTHINHRSSSSNKTKKKGVESITASGCRKTSHADVSTRDHDSSDLNVEILSDGDDLVGVDEIDLMISDAEFDFCHESPFRFVLQRSPPRSGTQTPDLPSSPATSPIRHKFEQQQQQQQVGRNNISNDGESLKKVVVDEDEEQCSPVCVLDPPFEDDEDDEAHHVGDNKDDAFDYECSYAIVQRAKQHLLKKLYRFEKLAELDPIELEKIMLEEQYSSDGDSNSDTDYCYDNSGASSVSQVLESSFHHPNSVPDGMKKLVVDLIAEEERKQRDLKNKDNVVARGVCRRLETWKEVDLDTIDMMVNLDMGRDCDGWVKRPDREEVGGAASEIEIAIFALMVDELVASV